MQFSTPYGDTMPDEMEDSIHRLQCIVAELLLENEHIRQHFDRNRTFLKGDLCTF